MDWILTIPIGFRLAFLFVIGMVLGSFLNWAIYQLCYNPRKISPWSAPDEKAPKRHWSDRLPFIGWLGLAREREVHGKLFWVRPMLIELACGVGLAWLYLWEIEDKGLHDWVLAVIPPTLAGLHVQFLSHVVLFGLLIAATFIDLDEKTIPDAITVPGTLIGLLFAGLWPVSLLPDYPTNTGGYTTLLTSYVWTGNVKELAIPEWVTGALGLAVGIGCLIAWWYALLPKAIYFNELARRRGFFAAVRLCTVKMLQFRKMFRYRGALRLTVVLAIASLFTFAIWIWGSDQQWYGLLSALIGMAFGGAVVWAFRVVASAVLQQEALGFGDVTLMAMIGTFVGWQPILLVFFMAPFAGLFIAVIQWIITRKHEIAYGPYLALAAVVLVLNWPTIWSRAFTRFNILGWLIPVLMLACLVLMAIMLKSWLMFKERFIYREAA